MMTPVVGSFSHESGSVADRFIVMKSELSQRGLRSSSGSTTAESASGSPLRRSPASVRGFTLVDPSAPYSSVVRRSVSTDESEYLTSSSSAGVHMFDIPADTTTPCQRYAMSSRPSSHGRSNSDLSDGSVSAHLEAAGRIINYTMTPDVVLTLCELRDTPIFGLAAVVELADTLLETLACLSRVKCNKVAAQMFGMRLEETVRILGDTDVGLLTETVARPSQADVLSHHAVALTRSVGQADSYLRLQSSTGWLRHSFRLEGSAPLQYKALDDNLIACVNSMVLAVGRNCHHLLMRPASYGSYAVDVKRVAESLGTVAEIHDSPSKLMQMSHSIQCDPTHLRTELALIIQGKYSGRFSQDSNKKILYTSRTAQIPTDCNNSAGSERVEAVTRGAAAHICRSVKGEPASHTSSKGDQHVQLSQTRAQTPRQKDKKKKWSLSESIFEFFHV